MDSNAARCSFIEIGKVFLFEYTGELIKIDKIKLNKR